MGGGQVAPSHRVVLGVAVRADADLAGPRVAVWAKLDRRRWWVAWFDYGQQWVLDQNKALRMSEHEAAAIVIALRDDLNPRVDRVSEWVFGVEMIDE